MLARKEVTDVDKFAFIHRAERLTVVSVANQEERSTRMLEELGVYLRRTGCRVPIHHVRVHLKYETDPWIIREIENQSRQKQDHLLLQLKSDGFAVQETEQVIAFPRQAQMSFRLFLSKLCRRIAPGELFLWDLSVLPRILLFTLADFVCSLGEERKGSRAQLKFAYTWAGSYFRSSTRVPLTNLLSHADGAALSECMVPGESRYLFLLANGQGADTAEAIEAFRKAKAVAPVVAEDIVFLFHKTAPHDFLEKCRINEVVFDGRREGEVDYIFSSLQVGRLLAERADEFCARASELNRLTLMFVPLGPKLSQFATYFGMREMKRRIEAAGCAVDFCDVFYCKSEDTRVLMSRGVDYCSIIGLQTETGDGADSGRR